MHTAIRPSRPTSGTNKGVGYHARAMAVKQERAAYLLGFAPGSPGAQPGASRSAKRAEASVHTSGSILVPTVQTRARGRSAATKLRSSG